MPPKQKTPALVSDLRLRSRTALLGLEDKDVAHQAFLGTQLLISDLTADWQQHQVLKDILAVEQCNVSSRRLRYRLAAYQLEQKSFMKDKKLVQTLMTKVIMLAGVEKQAAAIDDLCGLMHATTQTGLAVPVPGSDPVLEDAWISTALLRPLLHSAVRSPESQTVSNLYSLACAALTVVLDSAKPPCMVAAAADALKHILSGLASGQTGVVVPEAFQALKQCAGMLGGEMQPLLVEQLLEQCAKHAQRGSPWPVRKQAVDTLGALAASLQVYKQADAGWKLEKSASLAVLRSRRAAIEALLADVKYDKIAHVRQAALKVIAEMQQIPMPSPRKAGAPQLEGAEDPAEVASGEGACSPELHKQGSLPSTCVDAQVEDCSAVGTRGGPLQSLDGNVRHAPNLDPAKPTLAATRGGSTGMQGKANQPAMKRVARPRGAGRMDFGVQVYAKPPPPLQARSQAASTNARSDRTPAATREEAWSVSTQQNIAPAPESSTASPRSQETPSCTSGLVMDPSPLLEQLQLFQDQLRLFVSPRPAAAGLQTPQQPSLADQHADTVKFRAAMSGPVTSEANQQEASRSALHTQQPTAGDSAIASHDSFRQAMMERLRMDSQHLTHALGTMQGHLESPSARPSVGSPAQSYQHALNRLPGMQVHSTPSPWTGSGEQLSTGVQAFGGTPNRHVLGEPVVDMSAGSPASRALQSIRSALRSLPEPSGSVRPESALADAAEGSGTMPRAAVSSGVRQMSSCQGTGAADSDDENTDMRHSQDGAATLQVPSPHLCGTLSGVEREVVRILGPKFGSADMSPDTSHTETTRAKSGSDGGRARPTSGRQHQKSNPPASQPVSDKLQSLAPSRPSSASADGHSEISCFTDESGSLSRMHSNPLYAEEAADGVRRTKSSTGDRVPADPNPSRERDPEAESALAANKRMTGALRQDSKSRPGVSAGLTKLRHRLTEDLRALQELLDT